MNTAGTLNPGTYRTLAMLAAVLGLACAGVNAWFFALGMERMEADTAARLPLIAAGVLMIVTEHAAFGLSALLPQARFASLRRALFTLGALLLVFDIVVMYVAQSSLAQAAHITASAQATRAASLQAAIDSQRAAVDALRTSGQRQAASSNAWTQHLGANTLRDALRAESQITAMSAELAGVQAATAPTAEQALGATGLIVSNVVRSALIGCMGLLMLSAAGALWTAAATPASQVPQKAQAPATAAPATARHSPATWTVPYDTRRQHAHQIRARDRPHAARSTTTPPSPPRQGTPA